MDDKRTEFDKLRKHWMKEHKWKGFICARCGHFSKSVHLHHIQELIYGGENTPDNIIPLCGECHREWDLYSGSLPFEQFLVTMPGMILPLMQESIVREESELLSARDWLALYASVYRAVNMAKTPQALEEAGLLCGDLIHEQNDFFCRYPYADEDWRLQQLRQVYGELPMDRFQTKERVAV